MQLEKEKKKNHGLKGYNNLNPYSYTDPTSVIVINQKGVSQTHCFRQLLLL